KDRRCRLIGASFLHVTAEGSDFDDNISRLTHCVRRLFVLKRVGEDIDAGDEPAVSGGPKSAWLACRKP
ncbi:MAG: hypothetical protein ABWY49_00645, partial [Rhizobium sp.]